MLCARDLHGQEFAGALAVAGDFPRQMLTDFNQRLLEGPTIYAAGPQLTLVEHEARARSNLESCSIFVASGRPVVTEQY